MIPSLSVDGDVAILRLERPEKLNALSFDVLRAIDGLLTRPEVHKARALIVTGSGTRAFCAGADIEELRGRSLVEQREGSLLGQSVMTRLEQLPVVTIAALNGHALGGGLELALACDFRVTVPGATFALPEIKLGLIPGYGGTQRLPRLVGRSVALEMILTGRRVGSEEALRLGLVNGVVDEALAGAQSLAAEMTGHGLPALMLARDAVRRSSDCTLAEGLSVEADLSTLAFQTADAAEGLAAFVEKRIPVFIDA